MLNNESNKQLRSNKLRNLIQTQLESSLVSWVRLAITLMFQSSCSEPFTTVLSILDSRYVWLHDLITKIPLGDYELIIIDELVKRPKT